MVHADAYPGSQLSLISVHAAGVRDVQFLDCRPAQEYAAVHIPGALHVDVRSLQDGPLSELPTSKELSFRFSALGVDGEQTIVPYADRHTFALAGYAWWALRYAGYRDVRVLHGGFEAWEAAGFPVEVGGVVRQDRWRGSTPRSGPGLTSTVWTGFRRLLGRSLLGRRLAGRIRRFPFGPIGPRSADEAAGGRVRTRVRAEWMLEHQYDERVRFVDARTVEEFEAGHIPQRAGTLNIRHDSVFHTAEGTLVHPERLKQLFEPIDGEKQVVAYGRSGIRSGTLLWAMAAAGYGLLLHYDGSILDWEHRRLPLETGHPDG